MIIREAAGYRSRIAGAWSSMSNLYSASWLVLEITTILELTGVGDLLRYLGTGKSLLAHARCMKSNKIWAIGAITTAGLHKPWDA